MKATSIQALQGLKILKTINLPTHIEKPSRIEDMGLTGVCLLKIQLQLFSYNLEMIRKKEEAVHDIATGQVGALARCHEHTFINFILSKLSAHGCSLSLTTKN